LRTLFTVAQFIALTAAVAGLASAHPRTSRAVDPAPPLAFAPVRLVPVSARVISRCRQIQVQAGAPLLCPTRLPRASGAGIPGSSPPALSVTPMGDFFRRRIAGVDIGYGAPWEGPGWRAHRWRNRPCCFLHFDVFRRAPGPRAIPAGARRAMLGGRRGLLVGASENAFYGNGLYWANHVRFFFRAYGADWVATLHTFGEQATERLLGSLVRSLRPVDAIPTPAERGLRVGVTPNAIVNDGHHVWVAALGDLSGNHSGTVYRVDAATDRITAQAKPRGGGGPHALAVLGRSVWVTTYSGVARLDAVTAKRTAYLNVGRFPKALASVNGLVWVTNATPFAKSGSLVSIDPQTNRVTGRRVALGRSPGALAVGAGSLWAADELDGTLSRIDPQHRRVMVRIKVGRMPTAVAADSYAIWVANTGDGTVSRVDPATNRVTETVPVGIAPRALAVDGRRVWVVATGSGTLSRIDAGSSKVRVVRHGLRDPLALAMNGLDAWISTDDGELLRVHL
jgi:YVTN family beta-propeller protein